MNSAPAGPVSLLQSENESRRRKRQPKAAFWRQVAIITTTAVGLFFCIRLLPTGTNLSHMDFRVQAGNSIEFCDPLNPQFIPVVAMRSPVTLTLDADSPVAGTPVALSFTLTTSTGKLIGPADLLVAHTKKLHLLIVDPSLTDYQHLHPEPGTSPGEWVTQFTPKHGGRYRIFADFTPAATARGLYASADLAVEGKAAAQSDSRVVGGSDGIFEADGLRIRLSPSLPIRAGKVADLALSLERVDGSRIALEPIMGAFAHLVAFDKARSGFAHLHPNEVDLAKPPDATHPRLSFKVTIPRPGKYVIWAQLKIAGREIYAPFWFEVKE